MPTYYSNVASPEHPAIDIGGGLTPVPFEVTITPALVAGDIIILAKMQRNVTLLGFVIDIPDVGAPTSTINVGDSTSPTAFVSAVDCSPSTGARVSSLDISLAAAVGVSPGVLPKRYPNGGDLRLTVVTITTGIGTAKVFKGFALMTSRRDG